MFNWLRQHVELFLVSYADIGTSHDTALKAQHQHEQFKRAALVSVVKCWLNHNACVESVA